MPLKMSSQAEAGEQEKAPSTEDGFCALLCVSIEHAVFYTGGQEGRQGHGQPDRSGGASETSCWAVSYWLIIYIRETYETKMLAIFGIDRYRPRTVSYCC